MNNGQDSGKPGWSDFFEATFQQERLNHPDAVAARIVREDRGLYRAVSEGVQFSAEVTGAYRHAHAHAEEFPAVGDWVVASRVEGEEKLRIHAVLPRKTVFRRTQAGMSSDAQVVAANVDTVFIVVGLDGDFNPRRVERYVALAYESGARLVVILSKCDLAESPELFVLQIEEVAIGVPVHAVSSIEGDGVDAVREYLRSGETVACLGSSGVGKSTLGG